MGNEKFQMFGRGLTAALLMAAATPVFAGNPPPRPAVHAAAPAMHAPAPAMHAAAPMSHAAPPMGHAAPPMGHAAPPMSMSRPAPSMGRAAPPTAMSHAASPMGHAASPMAHGGAPATHGGNMGGAHPGAQANSAMAAHGAGAQHGGMPGGHSAMAQPGAFGGGARGAMAQHVVPPQRAIAHAQMRRDIPHERQFVGAHMHDFHTVNVRAFNEHERAIWRTGRWHNDWHYGRYGWWWLVGGVWYEYAHPIYPYPVEVAPLVVYEQPVVTASLPLYEEPRVVVAGAAPVGLTLRESAIPRLPAVPAGSYRCATPVSDYPVIGTCPSGWIFVPDAPVTVIGQ